MVRNSKLQNPSIKEWVASWNKLTGMIDERSGGMVVIRYSEAFKIEIVREVERDRLSFSQVEQKYGIKGCGTVKRWVVKYGNGTRGKIVRVEKPEEINELKRLKERVRRLEAALADKTLELAIEQSYLDIACQRAGITDVEEFKKKSDGVPRIKQ